MTVPPSINTPSNRQSNALQTKTLEVSRALEANFLTEMLKFTKFGETPEAFGGGIGEDQFSSFLQRAQAEKMVESGGIGLAEFIFNALVEEEKN